MSHHRHTTVAPTPNTPKHDTLLSALNHRPTPLIQLVMLIHNIPQSLFSLRRKCLPTSLTNHI